VCCAYKFEIYHIKLIYLCVKLCMHFRQWFWQFLVGSFVNIFRRPRRFKNVGCTILKMSAQLLKMSAQHDRMQDRHQIKFESHPLPLANSAIIANHLRSTKLRALQTTFTSCFRTTWKWRRLLRSRCITWTW